MKIKVNYERKNFKNEKRQYVEVRVIEADDVIGDLDIFGSRNIFDVVENNLLALGNQHRVCEGYFKNFEEAKQHVEKLIDLIKNKKIELEKQDKKIKSTQETYCL